MCGCIGNCILARDPIRPNSAWKALGVIGPSRSDIKAPFRFLALPGPQPHVSDEKALSAFGPREVRIRTQDAAGSSSGSIAVKEPDYRHHRPLKPPGEIAL